MTLIIPVHISLAKVSQMATVDFNKAGLFNLLPERGGIGSMTGSNLRGGEMEFSPGKGSDYFEESCNLPVVHPGPLCSTNIAIFLLRVSSCLLPCTSLSGLSSHYLFYALSLLYLFAGFTKALCRGVRHMCS